MWQNVIIVLNRNYEMQLPINKIVMSYPVTWLPSFPPDSHSINLESYIKGSYMYIDLATGLPIHVNSSDSRQSGSTRP